MKVTPDLRILALLAVVAAAAPSPGAGSPGVAPFSAHREVLDNGLVAIVAEDHRHPVAAVRVYVRVGSIYENEFLGAGMAHFVEHMLGQGTTTRSREELDAWAAALGGAYNAYTWKDSVCYHIAVRAEKVNEAIAYMADIVFRSTFPAEAVESEREVILNEVRMSRDEPARVLQDAFFATMFRTHPVRYPVIGYTEFIQRLTRDDLLKFYRRFYIPERAVVVIAGDVNAADTLARVRETFGAIPRGQPFAEPQWQEPPQLGRRDAVIPIDIEGAYLWLGFHGPPFGTKDAYALEVAATIAGEGRASRLRRRVLEENGLVTDISAWFSASPTGYSYFAVYAEGTPVELAYAEEAIIAELLAFREKKVTRAELARAKKLIAAREVLSLQTVEDIAAEIGEGELYAGDMNYRLSYLTGVEAVTADDILAAARRYFREDNLTVAKVVPKDWPVGPSIAGAQRPPAPLSEIKLPNGLRLLNRYRAQGENADIVAVVGGGSRVVAPGKEGLAEVVAEMLAKGTRKRDAEDIAREVDERGGAIGGDAYLDFITLSATCLASDFEKIFPIFADCLTASVFPEKEFLRERDRLLSQVQSEDDDWELQAEKLMRAALFPTHPYRFRTTGTTTSVQSLSREDAIAYYEKYFNPANVVVAVAGGVPPEVVERAAKKYLGAWNPPAFPAPVIPQDPLPRARLVVTAPTANEQAVVYLGFRGARYGDNDEPALRVLDAVLSGVDYPAGRLHDRLRAAGLVYVVHAYNFFGTDAGFFGVYAACEPANAPKVLAIMEEEIERLKTTPPSDDELALAKENWLTMDALYDRQTDADVATLAARDELAGLGYDWRDKFHERINAVTAADVKAAAQKYLVNPVVVITTPGAAPP